MLPGPAIGAVRAFGLRPDHLTRGAAEIRQLDAVTAHARAASLPEGLPVHRFESPDGAPLLNEPMQADQVARLVADVVRGWRHYPLTRWPVATRRLSTPACSDGRFVVFPRPVPA